MRALVIQHDHICTPGAVGERLLDRGFELVVHQVVDAERFHAPNVQTTFPDIDDFDAIVAMGAPWSAYDETTTGSWLPAELRLLREADRHGVPVLGICFGGQLLAQAHGGSVMASPAPELGWVEVVSDNDSLVPSGPWFQWHNDRWAVPPEAIEVARNASASQAFVLRRNLAVQFHPEMSSGILRGWFDNGGDQVARRFGMTVKDLLAQTSARDHSNSIRAHRLVDAFLDHSRPDRSSPDPTAVASDG